MRGRNYKSRKKQQGRANPLVIALVAVLVVAVGGGIGFVTYQNARAEKDRQQQQLIDNTVNVDTIYDGVFVDDIPLGGLTKAQAKQQVEARQQETIKPIGVTLTDGTQQWAFTAADMGVHFDTDAVIDQAFQQGRDGNVLERFETIQKLPENPVKLTTTMTIDPAPLQSKVQELATSLSKPAVDATITGFDPSKSGEDRFTFAKEQPGAQVDADALWAAVQQQIDNKTYGTVQVTTEPVAPTNHTRCREIANTIRRPDPARAGRTSAAGTAPAPARVRVVDDREGRCDPSAPSGDAVAEGAGYSVVKEYTGHGIGTAMHESPDVPNWGKPGKGRRLGHGQTYAVEPMVCLGSARTMLLEDGWTVVTADGSLAAHVEHTIAVTDDGPQVLTRP